MDLTSIDPKFTCTTDITILDFTKSIDTLDLYAQNKGKYFVINYYKSVFKWLADTNLIYDIESMSLNHDVNRSLSYDRLFPQLKNKKYILNSYEEFRPILIMDNDYIYDNIENYATTNNLDENTCGVNTSGPNSTIDYFNNADIFEFYPIGLSTIPEIRNIKNIVKYNFGSGKPFTLINLIYSILYSNADLTVPNTISNNNILLFAIILDTYISLSNKVENEEGEKIIEDVTKPIILHRNYNNVERHIGNINLGYYKENPVPSLFWTDDSHNVLMNDTIHTIEALDNYDHRYYDYYVTNLNFMETIRYGYYSNLYYSIMFPIFIPTPIDVETGMPAAHGPTMWEMNRYFDFNGSITGFDMFFILRLSSGAMDDQIPAVSDIKNVITYLENNMKVGNAFSISILACFNDHEMDDVHTIMLLCRGIYTMPVEIEYLETNGTQYVDVGLKGNGSTDAFEIEFQQTTHNAGVRFVSDGTAAGTTSSNPCQMYINNSGGLSYNPGSTSNWYEISSTYRNTGRGKYKWTVDYKNQITKINNGQWSCNIENSNTTQNIMIFAKNGSNQRFTGRFFGFKMWKNGTLTRDMIPVRVGHTGCILDKIENKLYNTGAGSFTLGPDKNSLINSNVYIETTGTEPQYIMTDCFPSGSNISFYIKFKIISYGDSQAYTSIMSAYYADSVQAFRVIKNNTNNLSLIITCGGRPNANGNVAIPITLDTNYALFCDSNVGIAILREYGEHITNVVAETTYLLPAPATPISISNLMIGDINNKVKFRLYGLKIWDNETCIGDFMPHGLNNGEEFTSDMEGVLYDSINDKILRNLGSGKIANGSEYLQEAPASTEYSYYYQQFMKPAKYIYVDDFGGTKTLANNETWAQEIGYSSMEDFLSEYLDLPDNEQSSPEKYKYTGTSITWNNNSYYLWEIVDEFDNFIGEDEGKEHAAYIITDTLVYGLLKGKSVESSHNNRYCPYIARLNADMNTYATAENSEDYIIKVEDDDYANQFFTLSILTSGNLVFNSLESNDIYVNTTGYDLYYSRNGGAWNKFTNYSNNLSISVNAGDKIYFYGYDHAPKAFSIYYNATTCTYNVEGNIMSLIYGKSFKGKTIIPNDNQFESLFGGYTSGSYTGDNHLINAENLILPATTLTTYCYFYMFQGCTSLTTAPELPATTLASQCYYGMLSGCTSLTTAPELPATSLASYCYSYMFQNCTSLITAPELPATTLAPNCYRNMFEGCTSLTTASELPVTTLAGGCYREMFSGCTSLTTAPELPATTLVQGCYSSMFYGCRSLTTAPELPATTLTSSCYSEMFYGCVNLNYIKALFTTTPNITYTQNWVSGVASSGTFIKSSAATWNVTGVNGVPTNWTVEWELVNM